MKTEELIPMIRHIINEAGVPDDTFSNETDAALLTFIRSAAVQIASIPSFIGKVTTLSDKEKASFATRPDGLMFVSIFAPQDLLRPVSLWLEGWTMPVYTFLPAAGTKFLSQFSSAPGIGAGPSSPVAFITADSHAHILGHAVKAEGTFKLEYVPVPTIGQDGTLDIPSVYQDALAYTAAALYLQSVNEYDAAKAAFDTAGSFIQTINNKIIQE